MLKTTPNLHFSKGVSPWFLSINGDFFCLLLLCKMEQEKKFWEVFKRKEVFSDYKNMGLKNLKKLHFSNVVSPWLLSKNGDFSTFCFYAKWIKMKWFLKFWKETKPFWTSKTSSQKNLKKVCIFPFHGFCQKKWRLVNLLFLWKIDLEKLFCEVLEIDEAF